MPFIIIPNGRRYSVINQITGHNFSPKGIPLSRAKKQLAALKIHSQDLDGRGVLDWIKKKVSDVKDVFAPSHKYNNVSTETLSIYGYRIIVSLTATREKVNQLVTKAMDIVSSGGLTNNTKDMGYDDLFHIRLYATLQDGKIILIEKNEVIYIKVVTVIKGSSLPIRYRGGSLTLQKMMDKAEASMGSKFFLYDAFDNNCASFVIGILKANNLWTDEASKFLTQDVVALKQLMPGTSKVANFVTSLGAIVSRIQGKGEGDTPLQNPSISMSLSDLIKEHKNLIKILKSGSKTEQLKEAQDQLKEMNKYLKLKGGAHRPGEEDDNLVHQAMSDEDLHQYFPRARIIKYGDLPRETPPEDYLKVGEVIYILYESAPNTGHWVSLARGEDAFYYMDSYGNKPDVPLTWIDAETRKALGEDYPTLTKMFSLSKYPVYYNDYDYQNKKDKDVATCGRWATAFLIHFKKYGGDLKSFNKVVKEGDKKTPGGLDDYICEVITE
jgi:hypothetical protein